MMLLIAVMTAASISGKTPALFRIEAYGKEAYESEADGLSEKKLVLKDPTDGTVYASYEMNVGDLFSIQFIHSVNKSSVTDWFEIRDDGIYGIKTVYYGFGAGVPTQLEEGQTLTYGDDGSMIISGFENKLAAQVVLTAFIPMLMDTGGNSGSQSSVTVIRALSLGELELNDLPRVIWKEIQTAVLCGVALATLCFAKIMLFDRLLLGNDSITVMTAFTVCFTMAVTVMIAKIVGCTLPMLAKRIGFDPAVMASPFITTIVDALSLLVYFSIATALLFG